MKRPVLTAGSATVPKTAGEIITVIGSDTVLQNPPANGTERKRPNGNAPILQDIISSITIISGIVDPELIRVTSVRMWIQELLMCTNLI